MCLPSTHVFVRRQAKAERRESVGEEGSIALGDFSEMFADVFRQSRTHPSSGSLFFFSWSTEAGRCLLPLLADNPQLSEMNGRPLHVRQQQFQKESQYRNMLKDQIEENRKRKVTEGKVKSVCCVLSRPP